MIIGIGLQPLGVVDERGEYDNEQDEEEDEQVELFHRGLERVYENLETARVPRQLEQPEYPHDRDELVQVRVGHALLAAGDLHDKVKVERERGHKVDDVDGTLGEATLAGTHDEAYGDLHREPDVAHYLYVQKGRMRLCAYLFQCPRVVAKRRDVRDEKSNVADDGHTHVRMCLEAEGENRHAYEKY